MTLFLTRADFERSCRHAGIVDITYDQERGEYCDPGTQRAYLVWESVAQTKHARQRPPGWLLRRRGKDAGFSAVRPYLTTTPEVWAQMEAVGWEQPLALWPERRRASGRAPAPAAREGLPPGS